LAEICFGQLTGLDRRHAGHGDEAVVALRAEQRQECVRWREYAVGAYVVFQV